MAFALFRRPDARPRRADPACLVVEHDGHSFKVALRRRPNARRVTLRISSTTGEIILTLPPRAALASATRFLAGHGAWIAARVARLPARMPFTSGAVVPVRGEPHRVVVVPGQRGPACRLDFDQQLLVVSGDEATAPGRIRRFLTADCQRQIAEAVQRYAALLGVKPTRITLRDTRSRWGSCSSTGALSFSWRLAMAPHFVLDYLAAHEVAHLVEMNHSHRFWTLVRDACPRTAEAESWLKRHGNALHRYG